MLIWYNTFFVNYPLFYCTYWPHFPFFKRINEVSVNNKNRNCARKHFDWLDWIETCFEQPKRQNHLDEAKNRSKKQNKMKWCGKMWIKREYAAVFLTCGRGPLNTRSILLGLIWLSILGCTIIPLFSSFKLLIFFLRRNDLNSAQLKYFRIWRSFDPFTRGV